MNLLDSLLDAIVRLEGDALVMHVGEKPYVVTTSASMNSYRGPLAWGQVELSSRVLTTDAVLGMLGQILSLEQRQALEEYGAIEHEIGPVQGSEHRFTIVAARGGDDVWLEVRRKRAVRTHAAIERPAAAAVEHEAVAYAPAQDEPAGEVTHLPADDGEVPVVLLMDAPIVVEPVAAAFENPEPPPLEVAPEESQLVPTDADVDAMLAATAAALITEPPDVPASALAESARETEPLVLVPEPAVAIEPEPEPVPVLVIAIEPEPEPVWERVAVEPEPAPATEPVAVVSPHDPAPVHEPVEAFYAEPEPVFERAISIEPEESPIFEPVVSIRPEPTPVPDPLVGLEPEPEPVFEPVVSIRSEPEPVPDLVLAFEPEPEPIAEPAVAIQPEPEPVPELVIAIRPEPEPVPVVTIELEPEPVPEPLFAIQAEPKPVFEPVVTIEPEPVLEPVVAIEPEPAPVLEPVVAIEPEPAPVLEPVVAIEPQPELQPLPETVVATQPEPVPEPVVAMELEPAPVPEPAVAAQPAPEAVAAAAAVASRPPERSIEPAAAMEPAGAELQPVAAAKPEHHETRPAVVLPISRSPIKAEPPVESRPVAAVPFDRVLRIAAARGASTVYVIAQSPPMIRVDGEISALDTESPWTSADVDRLVMDVAPARVRDGGQTPGEWVTDVPDVGRVRCVTFRDHRGTGVIFRMIPPRAISAEQLGLSAEVQALCSQSDGLVLVTGARASGKSTLLSAFIDSINRTRSDHVITIEPQIGFLHESRRSFVSQREVRGDSESAVAAIRSAFREDPDVVMIEDLRTPEIVSLALEAAESGRLVFGSIPAPSTVAAIDRVIELFPAERRAQAQTSLAGALRGVVSQVLLRKARGGRVAAREVLLNTPAVAGLIMEGKTFQLPVALDSGRRHGMVSLADSLAALVREGTVQPSEAYRKAPDREALLAILKREGVDTSFVERLA